MDIFAGGKGSGCSAGLCRFLIMIIGLAMVFYVDPNLKIDFRTNDD